MRKKKRKKNRKGIEGNWKHERRVVDESNKNYDSKKRH